MLPPMIPRYGRKGKHGSYQYLDSLQDLYSLSSAFRSNHPSETSMTVGRQLRKNIPHLLQPVEMASNYRENFPRPMDISFSEKNSRVSIDDTKMPDRPHLLS